jgi:hypothetical protein
LTLCWRQRKKFLDIAIRYHCYVTFLFVTDIGLVVDKSSIISCLFVSDREKSFKAMTPGINVIKTFLITDEEPLLTNKDEAEKAC